MNQYSKCSTLLMCAITLVMLSACSPIYKTEFSYVPPKSEMGNMCVAQCVQGKSHCQEMCAMRDENCRLQARQNAMYEYENYKQDRKRHGKEIKKSVSDFDRGSYACGSNCNCIPSFNQCYAACGGEVLERQVCVAFCDKQTF